MAEEEQKTLNVYNANNLLASIPKEDLPKFLKVNAGSYVLELAWAGAEGNESERVKTDEVKVIDAQPTTTSTTTVKPASTTTSTTTKAPTTTTTTTVAPEA